MNVAQPTCSHLPVSKTIYQIETNQMLYAAAVSSTFVNPLRRKLIGIGLGTMLFGAMPEGITPLHGFSIPNEL